MGDTFLPPLQSTEVIAQPNSISNITSGMTSNMNANVPINSNLFPNGNPNVSSVAVLQFILKISNLPNDITQREATILFSLVIDDILKIELTNAKDSPTIFAFFKNFNTCLTTYRLLNNKYLFNKEIPIKVEIDDSLNDQHLLTQTHELNYDFKNLSVRSNSNPAAVQSQPQSNPSQHNVSNITLPSFSANSESRSRFLFNDPFNTELENSNSALPPLSHTIQSKQWNGHSSQGNSQPHTPSNNYNFEWTANQSQSSQLTNPGNPSLLVSSQNQSAAVIPGQSQEQSQASAPGAFESNLDQTMIASSNLTSKTNAPNRRTSSAFFQSNLSNNLLNNSFLNSNFNQPLGLNISLTPASTTMQQHLPPNVAVTHQQDSSQSLTQPPQGNLASQSQAQAQSTQNYQELTNTIGTSPVEQVPNSTSRKDVPDLSLLARVPPPANPADQNPPCNTLYVGNLPPDATEQELRNLFSPQKGFRRLSFRTKNASNNSANANNHGPMCFVEFEDVAHATRALADLYGRILPRPSNSTGKGGIRLSFSKNPLGVRGPQRRSGPTQVNGGYNYNYQVK